MKPVAWAIFAENGNIRIWSPANESIEKMAERDGLTVTPLYALPQWRSMDDAPKDKRILVKSPSGEVYVAHWVQNPASGDEAFCISEAPDGTQHLLYPIEWQELFTPSEVI